MTKLIPDTPSKIGDTEYRIVRFNNGAGQSYRFRVESRLFWGVKAVWRPDHTFKSGYPYLEDAKIAIRNKALHQKRLDKDEVVWP